MAYSVTKTAGLKLMKSLAYTQGPKIRINAILPGLLLTEWVCPRAFPLLRRFAFLVNADQFYAGPTLWRRQHKSDQKHIYAEERGMRGRLFFW